MQKPQLVATDEPKIEKGVPPPPRRDHASYPFPRMKVNDSVLMPLKDGETQLKLRERVSAAVTWAKRGNTKAFCTRKENDGIRVWRIA